MSVPQWFLSAMFGPACVLLPSTDPRGRGYDEQRYEVGSRQIEFSEEDTAVKVSDVALTKAKAAPGSRLMYEK